MTIEGTARFPADAARLRLLARGYVAADAMRCVQCGLCEHNCPMGLPIRSYIRAGGVIAGSACLRCGSCVAHCPRGTLRLEAA